MKIKFFYTTFLVSAIIAGTPLMSDDSVNKNSSDKREYNIFTLKNGIDVVTVSDPDLVTSAATYSSRFLGVLTSEKINEDSKIYRWFNCLAYSTLAALIARTIIFPVGVLSEASYLSRFAVVLFCLFIFFISKRNFVYPTVISAIMMALMSEYL